MDLLNLPLTGRHLIEASAGTGKTYTITHLFSRLIMEKGYDVSEILVVTFTEKATKELKDRIRAHLNQMLTLLENTPPPDPEKPQKPNKPNKLNEPNKPNEPNEPKKPKEPIKTALKKALIRFDDASIFTIHGFLNRLLKDHSFESAIPFDTELVTDISGLVNETTFDFFRMHLIDTHPIIMAILLKNNLNPEGFLKFANILLSMPLIQIIPADDPETACDLTADLETLKTLFQKERDAIKELLYSSKALKRDANTFRPDKIDEYINDLDMLFSGMPTPSSIESVYMLSTEKINLSLKKNQTPPCHPFFDLCDSFIKNEKKFLIRIKNQFAIFFRKELAARKKSMNILSFDDLLTRVFDIIKTDSGAYLLKSVREKYPAILIDEFQDTDTLQYHIFDALSKRAGNTFFMIGDPKQSIYGFRGADIFSYIDAVQQTASENKHSLYLNWRSETGLVEAVNHLFSHVKNPFALGDRIGFTPVQASESSKGNKAPLRIDGQTLPGLMISLIRGDASEGKKSALSKEKASQCAESLVAHEIHRLLDLSENGRATIGGKKITPSDFAILVTRNSDGVRLKEALARAGIPSVVTKSGSVFHTREALELERLLLAVSSPGQMKKVNAALSLDMIGLSASAIQAFMEEDEKEAFYETHLKRFYLYHELWREKGFFRMFRELLSDYSVRETVLRFPDGERRLSNLLQLAELLHTASFENHLGVNGLLFWLAEKRNSTEETAEQELRLEHDHEAVQILTVFKSKGLEFPIVFCPFMWQQGALLHPSSQSQVVYHDHHGIYLDIDPEQGEGDAIGKAVTERLSELIRLLYVGVTRALNRCYLVTGNIGRFSLTSLDYIFSGGKNEEAQWIEKVTQHLAKKDDDFFAASVAHLGALSSGLINVSHCDTLLPLPEKRSYETTQEGSPLKRRQRKTVFTKTLSVTSYSALVAGAESSTSADETHALKKDEKQDLLTEEPGKPSKGFFAFPRGSVPGTCIHAIFENLDFRFKEPEKAIQQVDNCLERYGLSTDEAGQEQGKGVFDMIKKVLSTPLLKEDPDFCLSTISLKDRINEMAFYYPLNSNTKSILESLYDQIGTEISPTKGEVSGRKLSFAAVQGYMHGYIDLVFRFKDKFYIIDWKTNHLGNTYEDYQPDRLKAYMHLSNYDLQYHIYTLALHLYLSEREPSYRYETGFGGVFYLFVRGVNPSFPESGIFFDKPSFPLIEKMTAMCG